MKSHAAGNNHSKSSCRQIITCVFQTSTKFYLVYSLNISCFIFSNVYGSLEKVSRSLNFSWGGFWASLLAYAVSRGKNASQNYEYFKLPSWSLSKTFINCLMSPRLILHRKNWPRPSYICLAEIDPMPSVSNNLNASMRLKSSINVSLTFAFSRIYRCSLEMPSD